MQARVVSYSLAMMKLPHFTKDLVANRLQLSRTRAYATVSDAPLDKKVEMTNWEKVSSIDYFCPIASSSIPPEY